MNIQYLDEKIRSVCPIHGISIVKPDDKTTWRVSFKDEATGAERQAAQAVINAFDNAGASPADVNAERDRRIFSGFTYDGVRFQSRLEDQKRISGAAILAAVAIMAGVQPGNYRWHGGDADFAWIAEDNSLVPMDAQTVIAFGQAAARHETLHVFAARALKDAAQIPADYASDQFWP